jgi:hypothetical protein
VSARWRFVRSFVVISVVAWAATGLLDRLWYRSGWFGTGLANAAFVVGLAVFAVAIFASPMVTLSATDAWVGRWSRRYTGRTLADGPPPRPVDDWRTVAPLFLVGAEMIVAALLL